MQSEDRNLWIFYLILNLRALQEFLVSFFHLVLLELPEALGFKSQFYLLSYC